MSTCTDLLALLFQEGSFEGLEMRENQVLKPLHDRSNRSADIKSSDS